MAASAGTTELTNLTVAVVVVLSWGIGWIHTCRFHWQIGVFRNRVLRRVMCTHAFAALPIRFVFLFGIHSLFAHTCGLSAAWFVSTAVLWVWIEKILRRTIEPVLHALATSGCAFAELNRKNSSQ